MDKPHRVIVGDCLAKLRELPDQSVHCCVTSPPYYGLRDYGVDGQIGLEETPAEFVANLVGVFREVRRVLRNDGTLWINMGDSYASIAGGYAPDGSAGKHDIVSKATRGAVRRGQRRSPPAGFKPKDLMGMPWRLAFALQDDGWYLRQDIIWSKPNPMPESTRDRCTKAHEYIFLLSKARKYYCDMDAIREPSIGGHSVAAAGFGRGGPSSEHVLPGQGAAQHRQGRDRATEEPGTRNKRSVWTVATAGFQGAHFATFPPDLIRPCILAGSPRGGVVLDPFGGAGTTAVVAMQEGRKSVLCELNPNYAAMAERRISSAWLDGAAQMDVFHDALSVGAQ